MNILRPHRQYQSFVMKLAPWTRGNFISQFWTIHIKEKLQHIKSPKTAQDTYCILSKLVVKSLKLLVLNDPYTLWGEKNFKGSFLFSSIYIFTRISLISKFFEFLVAYDGVVLMDNSLNLWWPHDAVICCQEQSNGLSFNI